MSVTITITEAEAQQIIDGEVPESVKNIALSQTVGAKEITKAKEDVAQIIALLGGIDIQSSEDNGREIIRALDKANEAILSLVVRVSAKHNIRSPQIGEMVLNYGEWEPANWNSSSYNC